MRKWTVSFKKILTEAFTEQVEETKSSCIRKPKKQNLKAKFPLQKGDILVMESGEKYLIQHFSVRGIYHVEQYYLTLYDESKKPATLENVQSFPTLRELNYFLKKNRKAIETIVCNNPREKEPSVDDCHAAALRVEAARKQVQTFYDM